MTGDSNFSGNQRRLQFFRKWKSTSIFQEMKDDLNFRIWKSTSIFRIWKRTSIFKGMEDDLKFSGNIKQLKFFENGRLPQFDISYFFWLMWILNSQSKTICNSTNLNLA
jgi:hypothetical protein